MLSEAETVHIELSAATLPLGDGSGAGPAASGAAARKMQAAMHGAEEDAKSETRAKVARANAEAKERVK